MPDGISGFGEFLDAGLFSKFSLITGALPAQYGLHTTGILDITTKSGAALSGGSISVYGGSNSEITPSFEYGGVVGNSEYFVTGRYLSNNLGLESPTGNIHTPHDYTQLGRVFGYTSTLLDNTTRFVTFSGISVQRYQIPNNPGQMINVGGFTGAPGNPNPGVYSAWGVTDFNSAEHQREPVREELLRRDGLAAVDREYRPADLLLQPLQRVHFVPDPVGDLMFNNIATDVFRSTFVNGLQGDAAYRLNEVHTFRAGFIGQGEQSRVRTLATVEPLDAAGNAIDAPTNVFDSSNLFGWQFGIYAQHEWKLTPTLTLNYGVRFDQMLQYVEKNQVSPRASLTWQPWWATIIHAGYARYFTPPDQVLGRLGQPQLLGVTPQFPNGTTGAVPNMNVGAILPERSDVYDVGIVQQLLPQCPAGTGGITSPKPIATTNCPALEVGVDAYYKWARDLIDDGQFGQATILTAFNYDKGMVEGLEFKAKFTMGNFTLYSQWAAGFEKATNVVSNQSTDHRSDGVGLHRLPIGSTPTTPSC